MVKILVITGNEEQYKDFLNRYNIPKGMSKRLVNRWDYLGTSNCMVWCHGTYFEHPILQDRQRLEDFLYHCDTHNINYRREDF